jgi:HSP20 family protein
MLNLIRREPNLPFFRPFEAPLFREMEEISERFFGRPFVQPVVTAEWYPAMDIQETDKEYVFKAELPEVKKEEVKVTVEEGVLTIRGERKQEKEEKGKKFLRLERSYGSFLRTFTMPPDADDTRVTADFKDGLLYVYVPKLEKPRQKAIEVKVS